MNLELLGQAIEGLKVTEPIKIDLKARLRRAAEEKDELDRGFLLTDLRHEVKRLTEQTLSFKDLLSCHSRQTSSRSSAGRR